MGKHTRHRVCDTVLFTAMRVSWGLAILKVSIVIPAHNEAENLKVLLPQVLAELPDCEVIVVNDHSADDTIKIVESFPEVKLLNRHYSKRGMGISLVEGTRMAEGDAIVWLMADLSDRLLDIPHLTNRLILYDMAIGSRCFRSGFKWNLSQGYSALLRLMFGLKVKDTTNAFRAFRKEAFNKIELKWNDFSISPECTIAMHQAGFKICEIPTLYTERKKGSSSFNVLKMGVNYTKLIIEKIFQGKRKNK